MANFIDVITKYLPQKLDKVLIQDSATEILARNTAFVDTDFKETGYIKVANILMDGLSDYKRLNNGIGGADYAHYAGQNGSTARDGLKVGNVDLGWELFQLQWFRGKEFQIDYMDDEEAAGVVIGNLLTEFMRTKVVPEIDALRFSEMAKKCYASLGNKVVETLSASTVLSNLIAAFTWQSQHGVPAEDQILFVNYDTMALIMNSPELTRYITQTDYRSEAGITFHVQAFQGRPIVEVPSNRFFTDAVAGSNGYEQTADSKIINYMVVSKKAVSPVKKLEYSKIFAPGMMPGFYGYLVDFLMYHGIVIPKNQVPAIYCSVSATSASAEYAKLAVELSAGEATNGLKVGEFFTNPAGIRGSLAYKLAASAIAPTSAGGDATGFTSFAGGEIACSTNTHAEFVLVAYGKVVATSGDIDISSIKKSA